MTDTSPIKQFEMAFVSIYVPNNYLEAPHRPFMRLSHSYNYILNHSKHTTKPHLYSIRPAKASRDITYYDPELNEISHKQFKVIRELLIQH